MGTYGQGEIAELCRWCPPSIAVITAIGPVHLERFKSEEAIVAAKSEITEAAHTVVLNVDNPHLAALADRLTAGTRSVVRCSAVDTAADVCVEAAHGVLDRPRRRERGRGGHQSARSVQPTNLACALAVVLALDVPAEVAISRIAGLPTSPIGSPPARRPPASG